MRFTFVLLAAFVLTSLANLRVRAQDQSKALLAEDYYLYAEDSYAEEDYKTAIRLYKKSARLGNADAMYSIGYMYKNGFGVRRSLSKAVRWYDKAIRAGSQMAAAMKGLMYEIGDGVKMDTRAAYELYLSAAEQEHPFAQVLLGNMYFNGVEGAVERDYVKARQWYEKAARYDNEVALTTLAFIYENGIGTDRDIEKAISLYRRAADNNSYNARLALERLTPGNPKK